MQHFAYIELKQLIENTNKPAISIFLPTHPANTDRRDQIELKHALKHAELLLEEHDLTGASTPELLQPARDLLADANFWQAQNTGLAIYLAPEFSRLYRLPIAFEKEIIVNSRFQITPLLPFFESQHRFYILLLAANRIELLEAGPFASEVIPAERLPQDWLDLLVSADFQAGLPSDCGPDQKDRIHHYCQAINQALVPFFKMAKAPLVIATEDDVFQIFKQHCDYSSLVQTAIPAQPEHPDGKSLWEQGLEYVRPLLEKQKQAALASIESSQANQKLLCHTDLVLRAAYNSRVEKLFLIQNQHRRGRLDQTGSVVRHAAFDPDDQDLVNLAAIHTLLNGGEVYTIEPDYIQNAREVAAVLRY